MEAGSHGAAEAPYPGRAGKAYWMTCPQAGRVLTGCRPSEGPALSGDSDAIAVRGRSWIASGAFSAGAVSLALRTAGTATEYSPQYERRLEPTSAAPAGWGLVSLANSLGPVAR